MTALKEIDAESFWDIIGLSVAPDQADLVTSNAVSIAQAKVQPECIPLAIYEDEAPVGFLMYCIDRDDDQYWLYRLMIDEKQQGKGYAKAGMRLLIDIVSADPVRRKLYLGVDKSGVASVRLYEGLGFRFTGQVFGKESIMCLDLSPFAALANRTQESVAGIAYRTNALTADGFASIRSQMGWEDKPLAQIEGALLRGLCTISAYDGETLVGMGRLVGDGAMYWYVQDVVVLTAYQGRGIGTEIMRRLMERVASGGIPGTTVTVGLMAAKGKEGFYTKLGFRSRPNEREDPGMIMNIDIPYPL